jgi:DNA-binding NtrC family response regulator
VHLPDLYAAAFRGLGDVAIVDSLGSYRGMYPNEREALAAVGKALPTIYMTAHTWVVRLAPSDLGISAIVLKPFDIDALLETIEAALAQRRARTARSVRPPGTTGKRTSAPEAGSAGAGL